jgi:hypothetical protein
MTHHRIIAGEDGPVEVELTPEEAATVEAAWAAQPPKVRPIPEITRRQLRLWLVRQGIPLASIEAAIDQLPEPARTEAMIEWDGSVFQRANPLIDQIGAEIGLSSEQMDQGFREAALI